MRKLAFGTDQVDKDRFDILYGGACISQAPVNRPELSTYNRMMDKFLEIAKEIEGITETALVKHQLGDDGGEIILDDTEYKLLNRLHDQVPWVSSVRRKAEDAYKFLTEAPVVDKVKVLKESPAPSGDDSGTT